MPTSIVQGTAGDYKWFQSVDENGFKKVVIQFRNYSNLSNSTLNFPVSFDETPNITANTSGLTVSTYTDGYVVIPPTAYPTEPAVEIQGSVPVSGLLILEGF